MTACHRTPGYAPAAHLPTLAALLLFTTTQAAAVDTLGELPTRLSHGTTQLDVRLRHEYLQFDDPLAAPLTEATANATTLRVRLGYTTAAWNRFDGQIEYEGVETIGDDRYHSLDNGRSGYPAIPDAQGHEVNQAWLRYAGLPKTQIKYGRQRINLDNQRFVGGVAWRQDEQTFDAARLNTTLIPRTTLQYAHLDRVDSFRNFAIDGRDTDQVDIDAHLINSSTRLIDQQLNLTAYGYFLDFGSVPGSAVGRLMANTQTVGLRATGVVPVAAISLSYALEYAVQQDWRGGLDRDHRYGLVEVAISRNTLKALAGYEVLGGNGTSSFQTPLGTVHAFDGWADQFLITPTEGLRRLYASATISIGKTSLTAIFHDFSADAGAHYGNEVDVLASYPVLTNFTLFAKFAAYFADQFPQVQGRATDVQRGWLYAEFKF